MSVPPPPDPPPPPPSRAKVVAKPQVGETIAAKYRLDRILGEGGMGLVFAATHVELDQPVALKFMLADLEDDPAAKARFLREARSVVKLRGEHVARVLDVGTSASGGSYMVMEYLEGADLSALAKGRGSFPVEESAEYILQAAEGIAEAHALGIVHRDLKPANLFLTRSPSGLPLLKVLDFGISKANPLGAASLAGDELTKTTALLGSPRYMSPEQMKSAKDVDARSDIWSLGVILYRLAGGAVPFEGESLGALFANVMHEPLKPLRQVMPSVSIEFGDVVARCLEKKPADRFADLGALAAALEPFAPVRLKGTASRIAMVLAASKLARPVTGPAAIATPSTTPAVASTVPHSTAGGTAAPPSKPASKSRWLPIAVSLGVLGVLGGAWKLRAQPVAELPPPPALEVVKASGASIPPPSDPAPVAAPVVAKIADAPTLTDAGVAKTADVPAKTPDAKTPDAPAKADPHPAAAVDSHQSNASAASPPKKPKSDAKPSPLPNGAQPAAPSAPAMMDKP